MDLSKLNYVAIVVATLSAFVLGGIWFSPLLFAKAWMEENGFKEEDLKGGNMAMIYGVAFILTFVMAFNLAAFLAGPPDLLWGLTAGALAGIGWCACAFGIVYLFERKSMRLFLINGGYIAVMMIIMGGILGIWK
ncbi:MAG: DUF1761 domain-containing protein [Bacteroidetes bacterium]|nr:DUF1761 domain-containing protein [Bacteroidota bacterium]